MPRKSLFAQLPAVAIPGSSLKDSPRHWNAGLFRYKGKLWMAYRYHLKTPDARSGIAIVSLNSKHLPESQGQFLKLDAPTGTEHHEDPRLFTFKGEPYISYTEMANYRPGEGYSCVMKYARLRFDRGKWVVGTTYYPQYGDNHGGAREKNWVFFESAGKLFCIYKATFRHQVLEIRGEAIVGSYDTNAPVWDWGDVRGGTPPVDLGDGRMLTFFHSSVWTEDPPHFVRYVSGAYTFNAKPPFEVIQISREPIMSGSEEDGHKTDPRYEAGWKPYVVFPCGLVADGKSFLVSLGVNDWQCAIAKVDWPTLKASLGSPSSDGRPARFFMTANASIPVRLVSHEDRRPILAEWEVFGPGSVLGANAGYITTTSGRLSQEILELQSSREVTEVEYNRAKLASKSRRSSYSTVG